MGIYRMSGEREGEKMGAGRREKRAGEKDGKKGIVTKPRYSKDGSHECGREGSGDCGRVATEISGAS